MNILTFYSERGFGLRAICNESSDVRYPQEFKVVDVYLRHGARVAADSAAVTDVLNALSANPAAP